MGKTKSDLKIPKYIDFQSVERDDDAIQCKAFEKQPLNMHTHNTFYHYDGDWCCYFSYSFSFRVCELKNVNKFFDFIENGNGEHWRWKLEGTVFYKETSEMSVRTRWKRKIHAKMQLSSALHI